MSVDYPGNCNSPPSKWSFTVKLEEVLQDWHNESCVGMSESEAITWRGGGYDRKSMSVIIAKHEAVAAMRAERHWNAKTPDHIVNGVINYPPGLNQNNEGSRQACLLEIMDALLAKGRSLNDIDVEAVQTAICHADRDAKNGSFWDPKVSDVD